MKGFLRLRGDSYYFRCRIPVDLYGTFFNGKEILKALHTRDRQTAEVAAAEWYCKSTRLFLLCRVKGLPLDQLLDLVRSEIYPTRKKEKNLSPSLRDLFAGYIEAHRVNWREKSVDEVAYSLDLAAEVIGNVPASDLSQDVFKSYLSTLLIFPANHRKKPSLKKLTIAEIIKLEGLQPMSRKSVCKHMQWLGAALKHWKLDHLLDDLVLPTVSRNHRLERKTYEKEDLQRILDNLAWDEGHQDRLWVPLLGMLQGMRLAEICQLHVSDVHDGPVPSLSINDDGDKQIKNTESYRVIPIHPKLIELGFLDHVKRVKEVGHARLFFQLVPHRGSYAHYTGKWFQAFNRRHVTDDPKKVFHSMRHGFIDYLANNTEAKEHQIAWLVGHANSKSQTTGRYTKAPSPAQLLPVLSMFDLWKVFDWEHVKKEVKEALGWQSR